MSTTQSQESRSATYPTEAHRAVVEVATAHFAGLPQVDTILLVNSLARGHGTPQSDVDMAILVKPTVDAPALLTMEHAWANLRATDPTIVAFEQSSRFAHIHLDVITGHIEIETWDDGGGPDYLEVGIGNQFFYGLPLTGAGSFYQELQAQWLPYYNEDLRRARLQMVRAACLYDLDHVPFFCERSLYFQAFDRLYKAHQEFLQALFISRRTYPIAYNKWIHEQVAIGLGLPHLYEDLTQVLAVGRLGDDELRARADLLRTLVTTWIVD